MQQTVGQKLLLGEGQGNRLLMLGRLTAGVCGCFRGSDVGLPWPVHGCNVWTHHERGWGGTGL